MSADERKPSRGLGRGLSALLGEGEEAEAVRADASNAQRASGNRNGVQTLPIELIEPNPDQPRKVFTESDLAELADSIATKGLLQPILVRPMRGETERYQIVAGERRWRAAQRAQLHEAPCLVRELTDRETLEIAIVENVQREDLNPIELAAAYRSLADAGTTQEEIGRRVGKDRSSVANHLRLLDLSVDIQEDVETGRISMGHAKALLQVEDREQRQLLRDRVISERLSVRETEQVGREIAGPVAAGSRKPRAKSSEAAASSDPHLKGLADLLERHFQSRVRILGSASSGRLEIGYASTEDLDRITRLILEGL